MNYSLIFLSLRVALLFGMGTLAILIVGLGAGSWLAWLAAMSLITALVVFWMMPYK